MKEPKIRFKGFQGEWNSSKYEEVFSLIGDTGHNVQKNEYCERGSYPVVDQSKEYIVGYTDKVMPIDGSKGLIIFGDHTREIKYIDFPFCTGADGTRILKSEQSFDARFMYYVCHSLNIPNTGYNRHFKYIQEAIYHTPETIAEQQSIASFFQHLDSLIQSTTKKIESLKQVKAASLQSMFPQEGETTPRVRFKGFEGEWEKRLFSELYEPSSIKNKTFGADKIISVANMYFKPVSYISDEEYLKSYNVMNLGDIAFEGHSSIDFAYGRFVENTIGEGIVSHVFVVMKPISEKYDISFWKYYINYERIMGKVLSRSTKASTMMNDLVVDDFLKESIFVPSYEEQIEIGKILSSLDRQITLQNQRLEKLKQIKAACLDNMFV